MKVIPPQATGLPHVDELHPSVSLDAIGRTLRSLYEDLVAEGVPEDLAALVRKIEHRAEDEGGRRLALVVEDDPLAQALAAAILEESELRVEACESAEAALETLERREGEVAFVFADVRLSGRLDGIDLARAIAIRWPGVRVVVTSGSAGPRIGALPRDVVFLQKPWRAPDVLTEAARASRGPARRVRA